MWPFFLKLLSRFGMCLATSGVEPNFLRIILNSKQVRLHLGLFVHYKNNNN